MRAAVSLCVAFLPLLLGGCGTTFESYPHPYVPHEALPITAGRSCGAQLPLLDIAHARFCAAAEAGLGLRDDSRVIETWA